MITACLACLWWYFLDYSQILSTPAWAQPLSSYCDGLRPQGPQNCFSATISSLNILSLLRKGPYSSLLSIAAIMAPIHLFSDSAGKSCSSLLQEKFVQTSPISMQCAEIYILISLSIHVYYLIDTVAHGNTEQHEKIICKCVHAQIHEGKQEGSTILLPDSALNMVAFFKYKKYSEYI